MNLGDVSGHIERNPEIQVLYEIVGTYVFHFDGHRAVKIEVAKVLHGLAAEYFGFPYVEAEIEVTGKTGAATVTTWVSVHHHESHGTTPNEAIENTLVQLTRNLRTSNLSELG